MKFLPGMTEILRIAKDGRYNVLPVSTELYSDFTTPIEALRRLKNISTHTYLLESAVANEKWGRYTFLGYDPKMEITCRNGEVRTDNLRFRTEDPSAFLRQVLDGYRSPRFSYLPSFTGGLVGYFAFDYLRYSEPTAFVETEDNEAFKDVDLMLFDKVIAFDHVRQKIILIVNMSLDDPAAGYSKAVLELLHMADILRNGERKQEPRGKLLGEVAPLINRKAYCAMVEKAKAGKPTATWWKRRRDISAKAISSRSCSRTG